MSILGFDAIGRWAIAQFVPSIVSPGVFSASGAGALVLTANSFGASILTIVGAGAYSPNGAANIAAALSSGGSGGTSIVLHSFDGAVLGIAGISGVALGGTALFPAFATFVGSGSFTPTMYGFFADAERACAHEEVRRYVVPYENRTTIIMLEDRVLEDDHLQQPAGTPNRKRIC